MIRTELNWLPGPAATGEVRMPEGIEVGDFLLVVVTVAEYGRTYRQPSVVQIEEDGEPTLDGDSWGWSWADVSYWVKLDKSNLPAM